MKNYLPIFSLFLLVNCSTEAQVSKGNILNSTNIQEIENYLKKTHPDDPKKAVLKQKVIALKNAAWTEGRKKAKPMAARPIFAEIPVGFADKTKGSATYNDDEFQKLFNKSSQEHQKKTVKLLNTMFNQDISSKEVALLVQNNSDCNMVLRIEGKDFYNLAVPAHGENTIVVNQGNYHFSSSICDIKYASDKKIEKSILIILNNPKQVRIK